MTKFVEKLARIEFPESHVNLVTIHRSCQENLVDNTIRDQLLQQGNNPVSIIEQTKQNESLNFYHMLHKLSNYAELTVFLIASANGLKHTLLPSGLKVHHNFNAILNLDPTAMINGYSLLLETQLNDLKYKIELIQVKRNILIQSICFYCNHGRPTLVTLGCLTCNGTPSAVRVYSKSSLFQDYTRNFHGRQVAVCAGSRVPTFHRFVTHPNGTIVPVSGIQVPVLFILMEKLNFEIIMTLNPAFGKREANGSFSGLIGQVQFGLVEIGLGAIVTMDRLAVVEFSHPNTIQVGVFSTAMPSSGHRWQAVFESLSLVAWATLLIICVGFIFPLYIAISLVLHNNGRKLSTLEASYQCFDFLYRSILEQGVKDHQLSHRPSGQILLVFWMFFSIILSNMYKSRLVSVMVSPVHEIVPNSFEELAESDYKIYIQNDGGSLTNSIRSTQSPTFRKISQRMILEKSIYKCIEFSLRPKTACVTYRDSLAAVGNKNFTDRNGNVLFRKSPGAAFFFPVSFIVRKNALIKDTIHTEMSRIIDTGLARHAQDTEVKNSWTQGKQWARSGNGPQQVIDDSMDESLKLQHLRGVFLMLLVSVVFACSLLALEGGRLMEKLTGKGQARLHGLALSELRQYLKGLVSLCSSISVFMVPRPLEYLVHAKTVALLWFI